jgi:hypothetical protein
MSGGTSLSRLGVSTPHVTHKADPASPIPNSELPCQAFPTTTHTFTPLHNAHHVPPTLSPRAFKAEDRNSRCRSQLHIKHNAKYAALPRHGQLAKAEERILANLVAAGDAHGHGHEASKPNRQGQMVAFDRMFSPMDSLQMVNCNC